MERFIVQPSVRLFGGITVTKDTKISDKTKDGVVTQTLKDLVLTTKVKRTIDLMGIETTEDTKLVQKLPEGIRLVWSEEEGYIISPYKMYTVEEAIEELNLIKE